nr:protein MODIFIER OF SNC1 1-like [Physcomitrium patens]|eukprot:XP_024374005.1 protein MODIFIER OF SNC1 1-like [Physcomitrella patens]
MLTSDRRRSSARRGLQVLGKISAVPKPINLPSQRLENRGLDPNVEILPRGSVSWASAGPSPPASSNAWGTPAQASSPPSCSGAWGPKVGAVSMGSSVIGGGATLGTPGIVPRPRSGGSGCRPMSAESVAQVQQSSDSLPGNTETSSVWIARPSSASGVLGQLQPLVAQAQAQARPRSADITRPTRNLSEIGHQPAASSLAGNAAWAGRRRLGEEPHQASRFQVTRTDFPTLGSEKNPELRPQQSTSGAERGAPAESNGPHTERGGHLQHQFLAVRLLDSVMRYLQWLSCEVHWRLLNWSEVKRWNTLLVWLSCVAEEILLPRPRSAGYNLPERSGADNWRREGPALRGPPPHAEGNWHRDGPYVRPSYGGQGSYPESWRRERGSSSGAADDNWRRGGAPPLGQYGPPPEHGHYPHESPGFMHGPRFGPRPAGFGRGAPGPGGYCHHGDVYGNVGPLLRSAGLMHPTKPSMFQGPVPYDGFYGPAGPGYQNMEDPERTMMGMGGRPGPYGGYGPHRGPPPEAFGRFGHGGMNQGLRHHREGNLREPGDVMEMEVTKEEDKGVAVTLKSDPVAAAPKARLEVSSAPRANAEGREIAEDKEEGGRKTVNVMVVDKEVVAKMVMKDRWERGSRRDAIQSEIREVSHAGGNVESSTLRFGPYGGGGGGKSSILRNAPRNAVADGTGGPAGAHHWRQAKSGGVGGGLEKSEAEVPKDGEKGRILRRPESPKVQAGRVEGGVSDVNVVQTSTNHEGSGKEGMKSKGNISSHDGEKEWRPKVQIPEMSPRHPADVASQDSTAGIAGWASAVEGTESKGAQCMRGPKGASGNSVDAQRASMEEKATLKASRLANEEEERMREQKAKARAKLEELDRRFTAVRAAAAEEVMVTEVLKPSVEGSRKESREATQEVPTVESKAVVQSGRSSGSGSMKRGGRNDHAKCERDRKANGWKAVVGEGDRGQANGGASMILSASVSGDLILSIPVGVGEARGEQANRRRESRHRGRWERKQVVGGTEDGERSVAAAVASADNPPTGGSRGWNMDNLAPKEVDSGNTGHVGTSNSDGPGSLRKSKSKSKNSRNSRNKQRPEAPAVIIPESIQFGDIVSGLHSTDFRILGSEVPGDPGANGWHMDTGKDVSMSGDALTGDEGSAVSTNGDVPGKRMQRKSRGGWCQSRRDRGSQEQRAAEKSHGVDSMVWAPVRSPGAGGGTRGEGPHMCDQQEESVSAPQQGRGKRAEMERYTPKHLMKCQVSSEQKSFPPHAQTQGVHHQVPQDGVAVSTVEAECPRVVGLPDGKQSWIGDEKGSHDVKAVDSGSKGGRSHGSWRQRSSWSESAKDFPAANAGGSGLGNAKHHRQRADQRCSKGVGLSCRNHSGSEQLTATTQATAVGAPAAGAPPAANPGPAPTLGPAQVSEREYPADKKLYQPPRPAAGASRHSQDYRGQDVCGQEPREQNYLRQGPYGSDHKEQEQGTGGHSRHSNTASDKAVARESSGSQNGGEHPRSQSAEKERTSCQQAYVTPHAQQKTHSAAAAVESSLLASTEREGQQPQGWSGPSQHSGSGGEQGFSNRGRLERDQATRTSSGLQRGQGLWQQSGGNEGFRSGSLRPHLSERGVGGTRDSSRADVPKQQAGKSQCGHGSEQARQQQNKGGQQTAPVAIPSVKAEGGNWGGEGGSPPVVRGRDCNHGRRGRFCGRSGPRSMEAEHRRDPPAAKQRLVIVATGGAMPSEVGI